jgi:hypothetical protein
MRLPDEKWLREEPGRTAVFKEWLDSLETKPVKRIKVQVDGYRPHQQNYAGTR